MAYITVEWLWVRRLFSEEALSFLAQDGALHMGSCSGPRQRDKVIGMMGRLRHEVKGQLA